MSVERVKPAKIVIIADDLTGALDSAVPFARRNLEVTVYLEAPDGSRTLPAITALTTESRHLSPEHARLRVGQAARAARESGADLLFKKVDSLLRGNLVVEIEGAMEGFGVDNCYFSPALPAQGRRIEGGRLVVEKETSRSVLKDPLNPGANTDLHALFSGTGRVPLKTHLKTEPEAGIVIADAGTDADLDEGLAAALAAGCRLISGSSGLGAALARSIAEENGTSESSDFTLAEPLLIVGGSRHPVAERQTERLLAAGKARLIEIPAGSAGAPRSPAGKDPFFLRTAAIEGISLAQAGVSADRLAETAAKLIESGRFASVLVTGGDTLSALCEHLGIGSIEPEGEPLPGTVAFRNRNIHYYAKSGAFGGDDFLLQFLAEGRHK